MRETGWKTSAMLTPEDHKKWASVIADGCIEWGCKRPVCYGVSYARGDESDPKFDGFAFTCSKHC